MDRMITIQRELLRTLSNSWKNFKRSYDQYQNSFLANTTRTKSLLQLITLGLLVNSARGLIEEYYFYGFKDRFFLAAARELLILCSRCPQFLSLEGSGPSLHRFQREGGKDRPGNTLFPESSRKR